MGERLANKIYEIITSGHLRRLDQVDQEKEKVITMFKGIHGVGATTAQQFYARVCETRVMKSILAGDVCVGSLVECRLFKTEMGSRTGPASKT